MNGIVADVPGPELSPKTTRWRLGMLTVIAVAVSAAGVVILRDDDAESSVGAAPAPLSLPSLANTSLPDNTAPDFSVDLFDGGRFVLSAHLRDDGRPVLLNLWASWCFPCREEMPDLEEASLRHPEVLIVGVAVDDDPIAAEEFAAEIGVTYPVGADEADRVSRHYPAVGLPATFLISGGGEIVDVIYGRLSADQIEDLIGRLTP